VVARGKGGMQRSNTRQFIGTVELDLDVAVTRLYLFKIHSRKFIAKHYILLYVKKKKQLCWEYNVGPCAY
jgi:hypothetical protein